MIGTIFIILCPVLMLALAIWTDNPFKKTEKQDTAGESQTGETRKNGELPE